MRQRTVRMSAGGETVSVHRLRLILWQGKFNRWHCTLYWPCHCWAIGLTGCVDLTQTICGVVKRRRAVILLGLPGIWCKSFPLHSSCTVDPVEVANCFSLLAWLVSPWASSFPTLSWQQHRRSCNTSTVAVLLYIAFWYATSVFWLLTRTYLCCYHTPLWSHLHFLSQRILKVALIPRSLCS